MKMTVLLCKVCNKPFNYTSHTSGRLPSFCGICKEERLKKQRNEANKRWYKTKKGKDSRQKSAKKQYDKKGKMRNLKNKLIHLGTTNISSHFSGNFKLERRIINNEFKRLQLKKKYNS